MHEHVTIPEITNPAQAGYYGGNQVVLLPGGAAYFERVAWLINNAQHSLHVQVYILGNDATGHQVVNGLVEAANRGVAVYLVLDKFASQHLPAKTILMLRQAGVRFRWFGAFFYNQYFYFGRRLHHKVLVADGCKAITGGINLADRYNDVDDIPAWLDWGVYIEGPAAAAMEVVCLKIWNRIFTRKERKIFPTPAQLPVQSTGPVYVRVRRNDWLNRKVQITRSYVEMLNLAQHRVCMISPYFLPSRQLCKRMQRAVKRGVQVQVITPGKSDVWVAKQAERYLYPMLLKYGVRIYEYQPRILHGKLSIYDGKWVTIGSYNINNISATASVELNVDVLDKPFAQQVQAQLEAIKHQDCLEMSAADFLGNRKWWQRAIQWGCYQFIRLMLFLFTFYFRQR
ncbi:MAG TPA: phosphatidylserine/phosphatidylglycerophosphate/cardiolipin synthase family protein [Phnomibacter sp.]|nr:phosphatidylserine/phosphatidylglycerophosphate/cardiolipin synthase family protein [Phnomibacter sp.]